MAKCEHQIWSEWRSTADQTGLISPAPDGKIYAYMRECMIIGCSAFEYVGNLEPVGDRTIQKRGWHRE
jgi:hypothetical protein